ncbi:hypothetical protein QUB80_32535 [Chlorogloeopsis sp. ULAP01]|nr:hypothetical protein [Chlorogloeopsis sp. ULAP01]MDM9385384.1 hypothetical protein [Chlorogloeopsis sp. ULAP01]
MYQNYPINERSGIGTIAHIQIPVSAVRASRENCLGSDRPIENPKH